MVLRLALLTAIAACATLALTAQNAPNVERGNYLVNNLALCGDCHTPRLPTGAPDTAHLLQGSRLGFAPTNPKMKFARYAPPISGLPHDYTPADLSKLLQTGGVTPDGDKLEPPMPQYHLHPDDADAIAAYIASLPKAPPSKQHMHHHQ